MTAYYNEIDAYAAAWLRNAIAAGIIAPGDVDERSIADVSPNDLRGYTQCHFFAGIGTWSYSLRLAGWPDDRPVFTGSCPCQSFSVAGKRKGFDDPRHLWPEFARIIRDCRPDTVFGEQTAKAPEWLNLVRCDLEDMGYAMGATCLEAASAGADHFRDRYWFVAARPSERRHRGADSIDAAGRRGVKNDGSIRLADITSPRSSGRNPRTLQGRSIPERSSIQSERCGGSNSGLTLADSNSQQPQIPLGQPGDAGSECAPVEGSDLLSLVYAEGNGWGEGWTESEFRSRGFTAAVCATCDGSHQYLECPDGKWRRLPPPSVRWLAHGLPARIPQLRAIGNSIDPRAAATFITAYMECVEDMR